MMKCVSFGDQYSSDNIVINNTNPLLKIQLLMNTNSWAKTYLVGWDLNEGYKCSRQQRLIQLLEKSRSHQEDFAMRHQLSLKGTSKVVPLP